MNKPTMFIIAAVVAIPISIQAVQKRAEIKDIKYTSVYLKDMETPKAEQKVIISEPSTATTATIKSEMSRGEVERPKISPEAAINKFLGGVLRGKGATFVKCAKQYNLNPFLAPAIAYHETGNGTSYASKRLNNIGGMMGNNGLMKFDSVDQGIEFMCGNLKTLYIDQGLTDLVSIQGKYCPIGAANDPQGLNKWWLPSIWKNFKTLEDMQ